MICRKSEFSQKLRTNVFAVATTLKFGLPLDALACHTCPRLVLLSRHTADGAGPRWEGDDVRL